MNRLILLLSVFFLSACGGGGSGASPASPASPVVEAPVVQRQSIFNAPAQLNGNFRLARLDYRYDTPASSKDKNGLQTTSYEAVKLTIDQIKSVGFSGVLVQVQASINNNTGLINDDPTNIKVPPAALWKVIDYAKSQNLQVWLSLSIVDSKTDVEFVPNFTKFTEQKMFDSIVAFNKPLAKLAQDHKVDGIYVGEGNLSLESDEHIQYWKYYIDQIKTVYTGKLAYASYCIKKTSIWYHVDYASVFMSGPLSYTPVTDLKSIVALYNKDVYGMDQVAALKDIYNTYGKKLILLLGAKVVDTGVGADPENFFTVMVTNSWGTMAHPTITVNTPMQHLKVQAFFEVVALKLSDVTIGLGFTEFAPWLQDSKFSDPSSSVYNYYCCSWDITNNTDLQKTFNSYLSKPWGYSTIN